MSEVDVLIVAAHPDDAEIMIGGMIANWTDAGYAVAVIVMSTSEPDPALRSQRRAAAERSAEILGHRVIWAGDDDIDQVEFIAQHQLVRTLDAVLETCQPKVLIGHWEGDSHYDHVLCATATVAASRRYPMSMYQFGPSEARTFRSSEFVPTLWSDISANAKRKAAALAEYSYRGQGYRALPIEEISLRDRHNGLTVGCSAAECLRQVRAYAVKGSLPC